MAVLPWPAKLYGAALTLAALAMAVGLLLPVRVPGAREAVLAIGCGALAAVAWLHPIPLAFKRKLFLDTIVLVAAVLLLPPGLATLAIGAGTLLAHVLRRQDRAEATFNAAQSMLQAGALGLILWHTGGVDRLVIDGPDVLAVTAIAGVITFVIGNLSVATMVALEAGTPPPRVWHQTIRNADGFEYLGHGAQAALGVAAALLVEVNPWTLLVAAIPTLAIYGLLQRTARLRWRAESGWHTSEAKLAEAQEVAHLGSWEWSLTTGDQIWSDETYRLLGAAPQSFRPTFRALLLAVHPEDRRAVDEAVHRALHEGGSFCVDHRVQLPNGAERSVHHQGRVICDDAGRKVRVVGTVQDVTARTRLEATLEYRATHDPLTDLPNRALFLDRLARALATSEPPSHPHVAVLFLDLDGFKVVNDALGHAAGDELLVAVGRCMRDRLGPGATLARFGGDEFAVLLEAVAGPGEAARVAQDLIGVLQAPIAVEGHEVSVSASAGIALGTSRRMAPSDLLRDADTALYQAKAAGPGNHAVFEPRMRAAVLARLTRRGELRRALEQGELRLLYQPVVELATGRVVGAEALVRWEHPALGLLPPAEFIGLAEETGLVVPLGRWVLGEACREASDWPHPSPSEAAKLCVNVSARQLAEACFVAEVSEALAECGPGPDRLVLELTESTVAQGTEMGRRLREVRRLGVGLALDDFGTGHSSLDRLRRLPIDILKVDHSFVAGLGRDRGSQAVVRAATTLADDLGMRVTAEGIETGAQAEHLRALGVDHGQGLFFAPPLSSDEIAALLGRGARLPEATDAEGRLGARTVPR